jgi:hypothetical protein
MADEQPDSRQAHVSWCKQRALEYVDRGELANALASMLSDMSKHEGCEVMPFLAQIGMMDVMSGNAAAVRNWVEGFN